MPSVLAPIQGTDWRQCFAVCFLEVYNRTAAGGRVLHAVCRGTLATAQPHESKTDSIPPTTSYLETEYADVANIALLPSRFWRDHMQR